MKTLIVFLLLFGMLATAEDNYKLYPQLTQDKCSELFTIQDNYNKYDKKMKKIALLRIQEIKLSLLNEDEQVTTILNNIKNIKVDHIPIQIINDVIGTWKTYLSLSPQSKEELTRYSLGIKDTNQSEEIVNFIDNKAFFITPHVTHNKSQIKRH